MARTVHGSIEVADSARVSYLIAGSGPRPLVFLPGAGDGLATADHLGRRLSWWLGKRGEYFRILYISRRDPLPRDLSLTQQARDILAVMHHVGWPETALEGQSAGGALAQQVARLAPDQIGALVLSSTTSHMTRQTKEMCARWESMIREQRWEAFFSETAPLFWRRSRANVLKPFKRILVRLATPKSPDRLLSILAHLTSFDHREFLPKLEMPTLVTGGEEDAIFPPAMQREMAALFPNARVVMQPDYGHGNDLENPEHVRLMAAFARLHIPRHFRDLMRAGSLMPSF